VPEPVTFLSPGWADDVRQLVNAWPDAIEQSDETKADSYWDYFHRILASYTGVIAMGFRDPPGYPGDVRFLALTFAGGECAQSAVVSAEEALATASLALECTYPNWVDIINGYDIGKSMTYHKLPLVVGKSMDLLKILHFVHELVVAMSRVQAEYPEPAAVT